ncbi:MAG: beta-galactosidase trimerization domain-containing protein [Phycisphaerae bacterium]
MPNWQAILTAPVVIVGNHEPLIFRRRCGYATTYEAEQFAYEHSEELVKALAARGVNWVRTHFFKGFGLAAEAEEIDMTRDFTALCHNHGIKVELYTQFGTLQYETFLAEAPGCRDWCAVNEDGKFCSITYGHQDFRYRPCVTKEGYWEYFRKVLDCGLDHVKGDGFGFDNVTAGTEPEACHCETCRKAFVDYLKAKYRVDTPDGAAMAKERFGFAALDHIRPPSFNRWNQPVDYRVILNPVMQEWIAFRTDGVARRFREIGQYIKSRRPEVLIEYNVYGDFGCNDPWFNGTDMHKQLPHLEAFWDERAPHAPELTSDGLMLHRSHAYKLAAAGGAVVFSWHAGRDSKQRELALSEALAFNQGHPGGFGFMVNFARGGWAEADRFIAFRKAHGELFDGTSPAAKVALVEHSASLANNCIEPHYAEVMALGSLLAGHVPFDLLPDQTPEALTRYAFVILPDVECMSDYEAKMYMDFVKAGGALVMTGQTGFYDPWRRRRKEPALAEMLRQSKDYAKVFASLEAAGRSAPAAAKGAALRGTFGDGRFVYIAALEPVKPFAATRDQWAIHTHYWHLPKNYRQFLDAVSSAGEGKLPVEVVAPKGVAAEYRRAADGRRILHLVNYDLRKSAPAVLVHFFDGPANEARLWEVGCDKPRSLKIHKFAGGVRVNIQSLRRYAIVELA